METQGPVGLQIVLRDDVDGGERTSGLRPRRAPRGCCEMQAVGRYIRHTAARPAAGERINRTPPLDEPQQRPPGH
jgi:hypothetical protein